MFSCFYALAGLAADVVGNVSGGLQHDLIKTVSLLACCYTVLCSTVHSSSSVGKIQVSIHKQTKGKWMSLGQPLESHNTFLLKKDQGEFSYQGGSAPRFLLILVSLFKDYYFSPNDKNPFKVCVPTRAWWLREMFLSSGLQGGPDDISVVKVKASGI